MDEELKLLTQVASTQATYSNRVWLTLAIISIVAIIAPQSTENKIKLPFEIGEIDVTWFYLISTMLIAVLLIAFCSAQSQMIRTQKLSIRKLKSLKENQINKYITHPRDLYDSTVQLSMLRVAPIAQIFKGKYQFYPEASKCPKWRVITSIILYIYLKVLGFIIFYFLPIMALIVVYTKYLNTQVPFYNEILHTVALLFLLGAAISIIILLIIEVSYMIEATRSIYKTREEIKNVEEGVK